MGRTSIIIPFPFSREKMQTTIIHQEILQTTEAMKKTLIVRSVPSVPCYPEDGSETITCFNIETVIRVETSKKTMEFAIDEVEDDE